MFARDYRQNAKDHLKGNWTNVVVAYLVLIAITAIASSVVVGSILVVGPLSVGICVILLKLSRGGKAEIETIFEGFRHGLANNIVAGLLVSIFTFLWTLLFYIPGIVKSYSYSMTYFILADNPDMAPTDAITLSRKMMNGNKWRLFCLDFSFIGWILLSLVTFGIATLWVAPYMQQARAEFYESIKDGIYEVSEAPKEEPRTENEQA